MKFNLFHGQPSPKQATTLKSSRRTRTGGTPEAHLCFAKFTFTVQSDWRSCVLITAEEKITALKRTMLLKQAEATSARFCSNLKLLV